MSRNEAKMTLEERITQRIKDDTLMAVVGDEDAINELVTRALAEAIFQPRRVKKEYGVREEFDSPVVAAARTAAAKVAEKICEKLVDHLLTNDDVRKAVLDHLVASLPAVIQNRWDTAFSIVAQATEDNLRDKLIKAGIDLPS